MLTVTWVIRGGEARMSRAELKPVTIRTEMRQGNKKVTWIEGLEEYLISPAALCKELSKALGGAGTTEDVPASKGKGRTAVVVQGDHGKKVAAHLMSLYGLPKEYIAVQSKKK